MNSVLVTGGTGFIGSHLTERLLKEGRDVRVLSLNSLAGIEKKENLEIIKGKGAKVFYGDLRDKKSLELALDGVECVFHLGAISRPMFIPRNQYFDVNAVGTRNILEIAKAKMVKKFIHVSTVSVLGVSPDGKPLKENDFQEENSDYGLSKKEGEKIALDFYKHEKLPVVVVRPCLCYGPRCVVRLVMFKYVQKRLFPTFNKGQALMEFCYVDNVVQALMRAERQENLAGQIFNITDGRSYEVKEILETIAEELGIKPAFIDLPVWVGKMAGCFMEVLSKMVGVHPPFSRTAAEWMSKNMNVYDCSKAKRDLMYNPEISLREGIKRTVKWYKEKGLIK
ncbi:MAG: NAD(P)-dependent oxidoreductase [Candidatus Aceula meridiana]|nr:NAD(P)-dependent oxidoreductase [Candidatus Aceula meridiana]